MRVIDPERKPRASRPLHQIAAARRNSSNRFLPANSTPGSNCASAPTGIDAAARVATAQWATQPFDSATSSDSSGEPRLPYPRRSSEHYARRTRRRQRLIEQRQLFATPYQRQCQPHMSPRFDGDLAAVNPIIGNGWFVLELRARR